MLLSSSPVTKLLHRPASSSSLVWTSFAILAIFAALLSVLPVAAQSGAEEIVDQLRESYDVLELSDGWLLQPRDDRDDFRGIEIRDGRVAVDGEWVDENELKRFVDADATRIFDLAEGRTSAVAAPVSSAESPESPDAPESPEPPEPVRRADRDRELRLEELERVREQLERAIERAEEGEFDREAQRRLQELRNLDRFPHELDRLHRELDRLIERGERRSIRRGRDAQVTLGSDLVVDRDEKVSEAVVVLGNLDVLGEVDGDTTVVLGNARVEGFVDGTLVVVAGDIDIGRDGVVDGDTIAVGGAVRTEPGGHIDGEVIHLDFGELIRVGDVRVGEYHWPEYELFDFGFLDAIGRIFRILFLAVLALLVYVLAGAKVEEVAGWARSAPWRSLFSGLAVEIAFVPAVFIAFVLLCVSVIGLLVACLLPPLALFVLLVVFLLGYTAVALTIGDWLAERFGLEESNRYLVILLGMAAIESWSILGDMVGIINFLSWIGALILFVAWFFKFVVWTVGLGATVLCQFSSQPSPGATGSDWALPPGPPPPAPPASGYSAGAESDESYYDPDGEYEEDRDYPLLQEDDIRDDSEESAGEDDAVDEQERRDDADRDD
ncbi:MAG: polymer-forming cytoskeletal protein [Thermoanaerobaculia bacterium]|nr:polymer-forming cytoskeletal protein [Thermoanaerobaculia bacterium]